MTFSSGSCSASSRQENIQVVPDRVDDNGIIKHGSSAPSVMASTATFLSGDNRSGGFLDRNLQL
jgi:hypothetical protein